MSIIKILYYFFVINFTFLEANDNQKGQPQVCDNIEHGKFIQLDNQKLCYIVVMLEYIIC